MEYCRFCGKELVNGMCDCMGFQNDLRQKQIANKAPVRRPPMPPQSSPYTSAPPRPQGMPQQNGGPRAQAPNRPLQNPGQAPQQGQYRGARQQNDGYYYGGQEYGQPYPNPNSKPKIPFIAPSLSFKFNSFSAFISSVRDQTGMDDATKTKNDPFEYNVPIVPNCVDAEDNEIVVKQYNIAKLRSRLKFMKAEGRLMVTNKRVLFRAGGKSLTGNILQEHQFNLDEIAGIEMHQDFRFSFLNLILSIAVVIAGFLLISKMMTGFDSQSAAIFACVFLGVIGMVPTVFVFKRFPLKITLSSISLAAMIIAYNITDSDDEIAKLLVLIVLIVSGLVFLINLIIICYIPNLLIKIKTKGAIGAMIIGYKRGLPFISTADDYCGFDEVLPWEDTVMAMDELGTMIDDLQKMGDYGVEKWNKA